MSRALSVVVAGRLHSAVAVDRDSYTCLSHRVASGLLDYMAAQGLEFQEVDSGNHWSLKTQAWKLAYHHFVISICQRS